MHLFQIRIAGIKFFFVCVFAALPLLTRAIVRNLVVFPGVRHRKPQNLEAEKLWSPAAIVEIENQVCSLLSEATEVMA